MKVEVIMPQMGESIVEGTVVSWLKKPGDTVKRDEDIFTISTDKVDADIPSPAAGVLQQILVEVGATVEVGSIVAYIETDASAAAAAPAPAQEPAKVAAPVEAAPVNGGSPPPAVTAEASAPAPKAGSSKEELIRKRSTPLVRRIARENQIHDLSVVPGSGASGRVTKKDILKYIADRDSAPAASAAPARPAPGAASAQPAVIEGPRVHVYDDDRIEPMSRMRKAIADHMVMSRHVSAHAQSIWECDWTKAAATRARLKPEFAEKGVKLTFTAFLVRAAVEGLQKHPMVNAALDGDNVVLRSRINIGVAAAIPEGLIVPVVKGADELSLLGIARSINDLADRSRNKQLKPADVEGGTFTISNPGVFGSLFGIPIINQPQVAIIGVGAIKNRVVADDSGSIRVAKMNNMCLSFDHRVVDGAVADAFMNTFVSFIENFEG